MSLRASIIGAGQAGEQHAVGFTACENAKLIGVANIAEERTAALANRFGAKAYIDWQVMLETGLVALPRKLAPTSFWRADASRNGDRPFGAILLGNAVDILVASLPHNMGSGSPPTDSSTFKVRANEE